MGHIINKGMALYLDKSFFALVKKRWPSQNLGPVENDRSKYGTFYLDSQMFYFLFAPDQNRSDAYLLFYLFIYLFSEGDRCPQPCRSRSQSHRTLTH